MAAINVTGAAYAHPGGSLLFSDVSFRVRSGQHAALVGANGVGKSTLLRCIVGDLPLDEGQIRADGVVALMPQSIGTGEDASTTVRALLVRFAPRRIAEAGLALAAAEAANAAAPTDETGTALATAYIDWSEVGGYDQEARWDAVCTSVLGKGLDDVGDHPISRVSGGQRKRLVLESLLGSDADILLLDEPDNFLDIPGKRWLETRLQETPKTVLLISHDRELLAAAADAVITVEGNGAWTHPGSWATYDDARTARNEALGDALARWNAEERRLFHLFKEMKQRASYAESSARKAEVMEARWQRFVDAGPPPPPPTTTTSRSITCTRHLRMRWSPKPGRHGAGARVLLDVHQARRARRPRPRLLLARQVLGVARQFDHQRRAGHLHAARQARCRLQPPGVVELVFFFLVGGGHRGGAVAQVDMAGGAGAHLLAGMLDGHAMGQQFIDQLAATPCLELHALRAQIGVRQHGDAGGGWRGGAHLMPPSVRRCGPTAPGAPGCPCGGRQTAW